MQILKYTVIICLIFITLYNVVSKPKMHKQFVLAPSNFKLSAIDELPLQSSNTILFKISDTVASENTIDKTVNTEEYLTNTSKEVSIIPSSIKNYNKTGSKSQQDINTYQQQEQERMELSNKINSEYMSRTSRNRELETQKKLAELEQRNSRKNRTPNNIQSDLEKLIDQNQELGCPICGDKRKNSEKYKETIAWNIWRSRIQNKIMDTSDISSDIGVLFTFKFYVDINGNISNIEVRSTDKNQKSIQAVRQAIIHLDKTTLKFPENTNRKKVLVTGGFLTSIYSQYSSPSDYNDFEHIIR